MADLETLSEAIDEDRDVGSVTARLVDELGQARNEAEIRPARRIRVQAIRPRSRPRVRSCFRGATGAVWSTQAGPDVRRRRRTKPL